MCDNSLRRFERVRLVYVRYRFFLSKGGSNFYASPMVKSYFVIYETSAVTALVDIFFLFEPVDDSVCFACGNTPPGKFFFDFAFASFCGGAECGGSIEGFFWGEFFFHLLRFIVWRMQIVVVRINHCRFLRRNIPLKRAFRTYLGQKSG